ncbi:MAG TPA: hypothetical protein VLF94_01535 [Chlamydiales bacterium]|nr:hypothetical protein [Chlamydiales bacterium]
MRKRFLLTLLFLPFFLHASKVPFHSYFSKQTDQLEVEAPWFTGPLLASSGFTLPPGQFYFEPYIFATANTGIYNSDWKAVKIETLWINFFQPEFEFGLTDWMDFQIDPTLYYNYTNGAAKWVVGDIPVVFDFQLYRRGANITDWTMGLKFAISETIPIGKYQNLDPKKRLTDMGGMGSWQTALSLVWGNLFYLGRQKFLTWRTQFQYTIPSPVHVKNFNVYGGGHGTHGTIFPAQSFLVDTALELTLSRNWVFAIDLVGRWAGRNHFKGKTIVPMSFPSSAQFSIAPAIEYNWNADLGIIFGPQITIAGRNSAQFVSGIFAFSYYH